MPILRTSVLVVLSAALSAGCLGSSSEPAVPLTPFERKVAELNAHLAPIASTDPYSSLADLAPLAGVAQARFVGLGEATHGTREFFQLKHKILRYFVQQHGFRVFAIEADMAESVYIDRYVSGALDTDLTELMRERMHFWTWLTAEVREQIEWMRDYNATVPASERLLYVGVDCQIGTWYPDLITDFIAAARPDLLTATAAAVAPLRIDRGTERARYTAMSITEFHEIEAGIAALLALFDAEAAGISAATSAEEFRLHRRLVYNLGVTHEYMHLVFANQQQDASRLREICMANNTMWVGELAGTPLKTAVWGHNGHIGVDTLQTSGNYMMGGHLRNALGADYRTIGFSFTRGTLTAVGDDGIGTYTHDTPPPAGSTNELFHAAAVPNFILDFSTLPASSELLQFLSDWQPTLSIGAVYRTNVNRYWPLRVARLFDVIIHIDEGTNSVLVR